MLFSQNINRSICKSNYQTNEREKERERERIFKIKLDYLRIPKLKIFKDIYDCFDFSDIFNAVCKKCYCY